MVVFLSMLLIALANGFVVPTIVWWLFGITCFLKIIFAIKE